MTKEEHLEILKKWDAETIRIKRLNNPQFQIAVFEFNSKRLHYTYRIFCPEKKMHVFDKYRFVPIMEEFDLTKEEVELLKSYL